MATKETDRQRKIAELRRKMLEKQLIKDNVPTELWVVHVHYGEDKVLIYKAQVEEVKKGPIRMTPFTESKRYELNVSPWNIDIYEDDTKGHDKGLSCSIGGSSLVWEVFVFINKEDAAEQFRISSQEFVEKRVEKYGVIDYFASALYNEAQRKEGYACGIRWDLLDIDKRKFYRDLVENTVNEWKEDEIFAAKDRENIEIEYQINHLK